MDEEEALESGPIGINWRILAIETPGADYPPPKEFTEDLENEDVPPEKLPRRDRPVQGGRGRLGWEDIEEEGIGEPKEKAET